MRQWLTYIVRLAVVMGAAMTMAACGGGGSGAAPSAGSDPVAVEIPALGEVSGLPYASGLVVVASSDISAALKAVPSSWVYKNFTLVDNNAFTAGDSPLACEYRNTASIAIGAMALPDQSLCLIKSKISSITNPYDGNYHILATNAAMAGVPGKIKFKFTLNSSNIITNYEEFTCDSVSTGTQTGYVSYAISGNALTATLKSIVTTEPQYQLVNLTGTLNAADPTQYTAKSGSTSYVGSNSNGTLQGAISAVQGVDYLLLDGFDSRASGSNVTRIYGQADQSNTSSPLSISAYTFGAGAANFIDNGTASSDCWNTSNDSTTCAGANYTAVNGKTPVAASTQTSSAFSGSTAWDCSGTAEATETFSMDSSSCFTLFSLQADYIDCDLATQGYLTVTPSVGGTTLSTRSDAATSVSTTPTILVTGSRALDTSSTNSTTVTLVNNTTSDSVSLLYTNWNSDSTVLTLSPVLTAGQTYKLTLVGSSVAATSGTVIRAPISSPAPADQLQTTGTYYITAQ